MTSTHSLGSDRRRVTGSIVLVRHGETALGSSTRFYGATDVPLSPLGTRQMERSRDALARHSFSRVLASPLARSLESARIVAGARASIEIVEAFREIDFGEWEGLTEPEIAARSPDRYRAWKESGLEFHFPAGERRAAFDERVRRAGEALFSAGCAPTLAVLHKGVIRTLLRALLGALPEVAARPIALGSIHRLEHDGAWRAFEPEIGHLREDYLPDR